MTHTLTRAIASQDFIFVKSQAHKLGFTPNLSVIRSVNVDWIVTVKALVVLTAVVVAAEEADDFGVEIRYGFSEHGTASSPTPSYRVTPSKRSASEANP